jgi:hypothetical protein
MRKWADTNKSKTNPNKRKIVHNPQKRDEILSKINQINKIKSGIKISINNSSTAHAKRDTPITQ